jgi:uncharacterized RDD family membrane protein YckC
VTSTVACGQAGARLWRRFAAIAYDTLLLAALLLVLAALVVGLRGQQAIEPGTLWWQVSLIAVWWLFFAGFWSRGGQTLGMRAWRIRLVRDDGGPVSLRVATARLAAAWLSLLPAGAGYWWSLIDRERRCWHDRLTGTRVVAIPKRGAVNARAAARPP